MPRTLELLESRVSARTRWHFVLLREGHGTDDVTAVGECSDAGPGGRLAEQLAALRPVFRHRDLVADREIILGELAHRVTGAAPGDAFAVATLVGGLEQMLVDHAARVAGEPVWKWLGGCPLEAVPLYANINRMPGGRAPADVAAMAGRAVAAGFGAVKCAPFDVPEPDRSIVATGLDRLRAVRDAVGDDVEVKVDCHERLTAAEVHRILPVLADLGVGWIEDAFGLERAPELRALRAATTLPLAGGELMRHQGEARTAVAEGLIDVLMPDVKHAGGITPALGIARAFGDVAISPHNPSGPVATAASAHLFAACPNATVLEYQFGEVPWRPDLTGGTEDIVDGRLRLTDRPGLGVAFQPRHPSCRVLWSAYI